MEPLKDTINQVMSKLGQKGLIPREGPQDWLKNALTKKELRHIKVKYFSKGILCLSVDSSAWLYNLNLKKEELLEGLKKNNPAINNIILRIGEV